MHDRIRIAIDCRGLNYSHMTGVNVYTMHVLYCIANIKKHNKIHCSLIGVNDIRLQELCVEYPFLHELIDDHITFGEYLGLWKWIPNKYLTLYCIIGIKIGLPLKQNQLYDALIIPQPRPILIRKTKIVISVFHDIYAVLRPDVQPFHKKLTENKLIYTYIARYSDTVFANSLATAHDLDRYLNVDRKKIKWVYPALPIWNQLRKEKQNQEQVHVTANNEKSTKFILALSGAERRKNWLNILLAHEYLQRTQKNYNVKLIMAGYVVDKKYYTILERTISELNIKNVVLETQLTDERKEFLLRNCIMLVYPSYYEGFGFPILEAMKFKKPIVTSFVSSMPELAGKAGVYVNPFDYKDIAHAILILLKDKKFYDERSSDCTTMSNTFDWSELQHALEHKIHLAAKHIDND